ncbi:MAG: DUF364 domain-containing protein [Desulfobacterium sp.]|jgi:uncharacterized protein (DUF4213/DUF364 family)|nr:DUF364 domain-containing protein [Desulfobacterium sp.]
MTILEETKDLVKEKIGKEYNSLFVEKAVIGLFFTAVKLSNGVGGICYTPAKEIPAAVCCPSSAGRIFNPEQLNGMPVSEALAGLSSSEPIKTALSISVLNALSTICRRNGVAGEYRVLKQTDAQDAVPMPAEKSVAVVGAFVPTLQALKARGGTWWVIEQNPETLLPEEMPHYIPAAESPDILAQADILVITGVTLINHTLEGILSAARPGADIAVMGPTASGLPDPFFNRGVRVVGGVEVTHPAKLLEIISLGGSGYHFLDRYADRIVTLKHSEG